MDKGSRYIRWTKTPSMKRASFKRRHPAVFFFLIAAGIAALLLYFHSGRLPLYPCWLLCLNVMTFLFYGYDKRQSMKDGAWRVPEVTLHLLSLAGGFVGAFLGRLYYHHKTQKIIFAVVIVVSTLLHIALFLYF